MSYVASRKHFTSVLYVIMVLVSLLVSLPIIACKFTNNCFFVMVDCEMCDNLLFP